MNTREPFFVDDVTKKLRLNCTPATLKIPVSEETPSVMDFIPNVQTALFRSRRPSMEPYYQTSSRPSLSATTLSSYAKLSDIFDYHYLALSELVGDTSCEIAVVSDSESEPEDGDDEGYKTKFTGFQVRRPASESIAANTDLTDKLHFLTFKHNSRKATVPTKPDSSTTSDHFGDFNDNSQYDVLSVAKYRRVVAPYCVNKNVDYLDTPSNVQLLEYLTQCSNPLNSVNAFKVDYKVSIPSFSIASSKTNDCFEGISHKPFILDADDTTNQFLI